MSTIASALANASCSADPSELAAMIIALSNKNKNKLLQESSEHQHSKQLLNSSGQKSFPGNLDMEKYLKATEYSEQNSNLESFVHSVKDFTWDMSLGYKQPLQDSGTELPSFSAVQKQDLRKPEYFEEVHVPCDKLQSTSVSKNVSLQQDASSRNLRDNSRSSEISETKHGASRNSVSNPNRENDRENKIKRNSSTVAPLSIKTLEDEAKSGIRLSDDKSNLKEGNSCFLSNTKTNFHLPNDPKFAVSSKESYNIQNDTPQKHVSFQPPSSGLHQKMSGKSAIKNINPTLLGCILIVLSTF